MHWIDDDALDRTYLDTLRRIEVPDALGAAHGRNLVNRRTHRDGLIGTDRLADVAVDAGIENLEGHSAIPNAVWPRSVVPECSGSAQFGVMVIRAALGHAFLDAIEVRLGTNEQHDHALERTFLRFLERLDDQVGGKAGVRTAVGHQVAGQHAAADRGLDVLELVVARAPP